MPKLTLLAIMFSSMIFVGCLEVNNKNEIGRFQLFNAQYTPLEHSTLTRLTPHRGTRSSATMKIDTKTGKIWIFSEIRKDEIGAVLHEWQEIPSALGRVQFTDAVTEHALKHLPRQGIQQLMNEQMWDQLSIDQKRKIVLKFNPDWVAEPDSKKVLAIQLGQMSSWLTRHLWQHFYPVAHNQHITKGTPDEHRGTFRTIGKTDAVL